MAINLSAAPGSWPAKQNPSLTSDHFLTFLDVGKTPVSLTLKPDGGEIFVSNFDSDTISEIATNTNEVGSTYPIGNKPVHGLVSNDNSTLWVSNFGADSISLYSIDDGRMSGSVRTGPAPDALVFSPTSTSSSPPTPTPATSPSSAPRATPTPTSSPSYPPAAPPTPSPSKPSWASPSSLASASLLLRLRLTSQSQRIPRRRKMRSSQQQKSRQKRPHHQPHRNIKRPIDRLKIQPRQRPNIRYFASSHSSPITIAVGSTASAGTFRFGSTQ